MRPPRRGAGRARSARGLAALAGAVLVASSAGCFPLHAGGRTGRTLRVGGIVPGRTTKAELFASLGAPLAIVGRGEYAEATAATVRRSTGQRGWFVLQSGGSYPVQGDAVLELFADRHALGADHRVYYYCSTDDSGLGLLFLVVAVERYSAETAEAWVLVDESSERVVDVIHRADR